MSQVRPLTARLSLALIAILLTESSDLNAADSATAVDYLKAVKPILTAKCVACHGGLRQKGNLRLDTAQFALKGGDSGPAITVGDSAKSVMIEAILGENGRTKMPVEGDPLKPEQIEILRRWIDAGAKAPADEPVADPRDHWAFKKPARTQIPNLAALIENQKSKIENPIDTFLAAEQQSRHLTPLPEADKATLLRRVFIDLVGLPPTSAELHDFLDDHEPDAYERVVDRLLESPEHARRWARHWMDIWRYSDWYGSRGGNELRNSRRHIWRWRDWIVESLAADKGYDRMVSEMLAADEIAPGDRDIGRATGFLGRNYYVFNRNVWLHDTVEFTSAAFLGLTFKCCRCHDHKYDPLAQEEYFRLRAFFEPLNVRTDQLAGKTELITGQWPAGAPPGNKLKDGDDFVFDADLAVPTYLLDRGNEKNPVTDKPLAPGVPSVLNLPLAPIEPITLPLNAFYPDLRADRRQELIDNAKAAITQAESDAAKKQATVEKAKQQLTNRRAGGVSPPVDLKPNSPAPTGGLTPPARQEVMPFLDDNFATHNKEVWKILSGNWVFEDKKLKLKSPGHFVTITTLTDHPQDFKATLKYRTLEGGVIGSVGLFFDMVELKAAQAVYTAIGTGNSTVQAFHRVNGSEVYPGAGIVPAPVKINEDMTLEITTRGQELKIWLNGKLKLTYAMPVPRQPGRFALWCHDGVAEFHSLKIVPFEPTVDELRLALRTAESEAALAVKSVEVACAEAVAIEARVAAEVEKHVARTPASERPDVGVRSTMASRAERLVTLAKAELEALRAEQQLGNVEFEISNWKSQIADPKKEEARKAAETKLTAARAAVEVAKTNAAKEDANYTPLGPTYPTTSSGRRLALARWMTDKDNPLTARVAVNHVWKRHFGTALVPSVANFGLNGKLPTHPALLDWLAVEFRESGWSLKRLHRLMVTSAAYRRSSGEGRGARGEQDRSPDHPPLAPNPSPLATDPDNRFYWRANVRRMEAEVVRDTLWSLTVGLDRSFSGPELDPTVADTTPRRSLYFRHTPDDQAMMLELFDGPSAAECFERTDSIMPQQALALANSPLALMQSRKLAQSLSEAPAGTALTSDADFLRAAFERVLSRTPNADELAKTEAFLQRQTAALADPSKLTRTTTGLNSSLAPSTDPRLRARENLVHVLLNYHEFVTIR